MTWDIMFQVYYILLQKYIIIYSIPVSEGGSPHGVDESGELLGQHTLGAERIGHVQVVAISGHVDINR